jgi:hypothetical protein
MYVWNLRSRLKYKISDVAIMIAPNIFWILLPCDLSHGVLEKINPVPRIIRKRGIAVPIE